MHSFKLTARTRRRISRFLLLSLLVVTSWGLPPAHANGVNSSIGNGEIKYGTVTGTGVDTYTFTVPTDHTNWLVTVGQTGPLDANFYANLALYDPTGAYFTAVNFDVRGRIYSTPMAGTWTAKIKRNDAPGTTGGAYALHLLVAVPDQISITPPNQGGAMYPSTTYGGSIGDAADRANLGVWTFNGVAGAYATFTLSAGGTGNTTNFVVQDPSGTYVTSTVGTSLIMYMAAAGPYTVFVSRVDGTDSVGTYTLSATGIGLPVDAKADGVTCLTCQSQANAANIAPLAAQSPPVTSTGGAAVGDPINIATGNLVEQVTDYSTAGANPLAFIRTYNSLSYTRSLYPTLMGPNWRTNYDRYLQIVSSTQVAAQRADGRVVNFNLVGSTWTPDSDVDVTLSNSGTTWTLTDSDDTVETYTAAAGKGTLNTIKLRNGYTQTLHYTAGVLTSVSDSYSRALGFTYTGGVLTGVTTPDTLALTYGYTATLAQQLLTSVAYNTSPVTNQTYLYENASLPFALTGITDENGNRYATWAYDGAGRASSSQLAGGADLTQVSYDDVTGNRTVTGPLGIQETYKFTTLQGVSKVTEIDRAANGTVTAATRTFGYDSNGYLNSATDWNGNSTTWVNNAHGDPTTINEAVGAPVARTTTITYDTTWVHLPHIIVTPGTTTTNNFDAATGNLLTRVLLDTTTQTIPYSTNGQTRTWTYTYTATGQLKTAQLPRTDVVAKTTYTYTGGTLTKITDAKSHITTINTHTGGGLPTQVTDPNNVVSNLAYDNRNRLTSVTVVASPSNEVTGYQYYPTGQLNILTLPDSSTLTYTYDNAHRLTKITNTAGETINYTPDAMGNITLKTIKNSSGTVVATHSATFDALGDMLTSVGAAGATQTTGFAWDGNRNRTSVTDANSNTTGTAWDALNRASTVTDALTHTATPTYDARNNVTNQTDFNGYATSFVYDGFPDAAIQKVSPDTGTAVYYYDLDGNQNKRVDARSVETDRTFDALDRVLTESYPSYTAEKLTYTYDATTGNLGKGRLTKVADESGSTTFVYNSFGNITSSVRVIGTKTYATSYSYDLANRLKEIIYPSGRYVDYTYDGSGYLTTVTTKPSSGGTVTTLASSIVHEPFGPIASFTLGNTLSQTNSWDANYWLDDIVTANGSTHIQNLTYGYDNAGNLSGITDNLAAGRDETYGVDSLNRLHTATGAYGSRNYTYDNNSNRATWYNGTITRTTTNNTGANTVASITDGTNTRHFTYSASGNVATDDRVMDGGVAISNTYGGRDRLESMTVGTPTITFKINALGQRVEKATISASTAYHYDLAGHIIGEANASTGANLREYVWMEGVPLAQIDSSGNIFYIHSNQVGAPQKITNGSMTLVWDRVQEPFGEDYSTPTNITATNWRFPGQYYDAENLLNHNGSRDYDPTLPGYVEADRIGFRGGLNLYAYAKQNPTQFTDRLGLCPYGQSCPDEQKAGYVYSANACMFGGCIGLSTNSAGYLYFNWGWGLPRGPGFSAMATNNMQNYCTGWTAQTGAVAVGGNEGSLGSGINIPPAASMLNGVPIDPAYNWGGFSNDDFLGGGL